jgi:hypothetical protein
MSSADTLSSSVILNGKHARIQMFLDKLRLLHARSSASHTLSAALVAHALILASLAMHARVAVTSADAQSLNLPCYLLTSTLLVR